MIIKASLLPADQARYERALANAPQSVLYLARSLERAAFPEKDFDGGFKPAPVYLTQAVTLAVNLELRSRFIEAFDEMGSSSVEVL